MAPALRAWFPDVAPHDDHDGVRGKTLKLVMLGLADGANEDGTGARPGIRTLALFAQCHPETVVHALAALVALGAISLDRPAHSNRAATYTVDLNWLHERTAERHRPKTLRAGHPRAEPRTGNPRAARGSDPRAARGSDPRISVLPVSTSPDETVCTRPTPPPWVVRGMSHLDWLREQRGEP